jgi:chaperonin cofactor prefoldin
MNNPSDLAFTAYPGDSVACPEKVYAYIEALEGRIQKLESQMRAITNPLSERRGSLYDLNNPPTSFRGTH